MGELDDLANAAQSTSTPTWRPRPKKPSSKAPLLIVVGAIVVAGGIFVAYEMGRSRETTVVRFGAGPNAPMIQIDRPKERNPGFTIEPGSRSDGGRPFWSGWIITNTIEKPLIVHRFRYNNEKDAVTSPMFSKSPEAEKKSGPWKLTIGDSIAFFERLTYETPESYSKEVIFIDIDTDRGKFRYRPGKGFDE